MVFRKLVFTFVIVVIPPLLIRRNIHFLCHSRCNAYLLREVLVVEGLLCHVQVFDPEADIFDVLARVISQSSVPSSSVALCS